LDANYKNKNRSRLPNRALQRDRNREEPYGESQGSNVLDQRLLPRAIPDRDAGRPSAIVMRSRMKKVEPAVPSISSLLSTLRFL
jgi:hypothetical protein